MIYAVSVFLYTALEQEQKLRRWYFPYLLVAYNVAFTLTYIFIPAYFTVFVITFIASCVWLVALSVDVYKRTRDARMRRLFLFGVGLYAVAFFFMWIPDNVFCGSIGFMQLHAWFHLCSAVAPYWWAVFIVLNFYQRAHESRLEQVRAAAAAGGGGRTGAGTGQSTAEGGSGGKREADAVAVDVPVPELRWYGPRSLVIWPYVHLARKPATD
jgi:hypothetical protein